MNSYAVIYLDNDYDLARILVEGKGVADADAAARSVLSSRHPDRTPETWDILTIERAASIEWRVLYSRPGDRSRSVEVLAKNGDDAEIKARQKLAVEHPQIASDEWKIDSVKEASPDIDVEDLPRPGENLAHKAISEFFIEEFGSVPDFSMEPSGDNSWAFYIDEDENTSYLKANLKIESYGFNWNPEADDDENEDDDVEESVPAL